MYTTFKVRFANNQETNHDKRLQLVYGWSGSCGYAASSLQFYSDVSEQVVAQIVFYLLDVGTSNALVLYNLTKKENQQPTSIVDFKSELVMTLVGTRFESLPEVTVQHLPLRGQQRNRCVYCAMFSRMRRTRFKCSAPCCNIPLCSVSTGNTEHNCFTLCHANQEIHKAVLAKYQIMQKSVNARYK